jgi:hypothetical protein
MDAAMRPRREPNRERAYNGADRRPAQNLETAYRLEWAVNGRRRGHPGRPPRELPPSPAVVGARLPIDLGPLMRLAQESRWARVFNRPRHSAIADA